MKRTIMLSVAIFVGSSLAMAQMPLEGVGTKHTLPAPAAAAHVGATFSENPEGLGVPRVEIFGSYSLAIPAPSWGLPSNTRGIGVDTSLSVNLKRLFAVEGDFGWNRATANIAGLTQTDRFMLFSGGPRFTYRQGRLSVFSHALFGANRITNSIPSLSINITDTSLAAVIGAGADIEISRHLSLRNQADYLPTHHLSQMQNNHRFSFGFVVKP